MFRPNRLAGLILPLALVGMMLARPQAQSAKGPALAIAAASDLQSVLPQLAAGFERATGVSATVSFGSSGSFFAQIQNGAPFDIFMSADVDYPQRLIDAGQADGPSLYRYATGQLVLWTRTDSGLDVRRGLPLLRDPRVRRIAIANPDLAPYGRAAVAALQAEQLYDPVRGKLVFGDNISQTAQLAQSGNADVGLLSHSLALAPAMKASGTFTTIPPRSYPAIVQAAVLVSATKKRDSGNRFLEYLKGAAARKTLASFGFGPPPSR